MDAIADASKVWWLGTTFMKTHLNNDAVGTAEVHLAWEAPACTSSNRSGEETYEGCKSLQARTWNCICKH